MIGKEMQKMFLSLFLSFFFSIPVLTAGFHTGFSPLPTSAFAIESTSET